MSSCPYWYGVNSVDPQCFFLRCAMRKEEVPRTTCRDGRLQIGSQQLMSRSRWWTPANALSSAMNLETDHVGPKASMARPYLHQTRCICKQAVFCGKSIPLKSFLKALGSRWPSAWNQWEDVQLVGRLECLWLFKKSLRNKAVVFTQIPGQPARSTSTFLNSRACRNVDQA